MNFRLKHCGLAAALGLCAMSAHAHFYLEAPASWIMQDEMGDPQKIAPCGGTNADGGTRTGAVTAVSGGALLRIAVLETVFHPGHYRVALARKINWLPDDPVAVMKQTENGPRSDYGQIDSDPEAPILVDGLWASDVKREPDFETEIRIPNIDCEGCYLQVIQFMENHPGVREGDFSYHHCAILNITADTTLPLDEGW
ncbi:MAG: hypothetical protein RLZZ227_1754 [Pseudomonadota bacterium]|jgi:hypothetical protein